MLTIYEGIILFKALPKDELATAMKRTAGFIFTKGGFIRQLEYMGHQKCPYRISKNGLPNWEAHYTYYEFNVPKIEIPSLYGEMTRDLDIIKHSFVKRFIPPETIDYETCTFEDENLPVPYRSEVQKYVDLAYKRKNSPRKTRKVMRLNMNCDFYPFQR